MELTNPLFPFNSAHAHLTIAPYNLPPIGFTSSLNPEDIECARHHVFRGQQDLKVPTGVSTTDNLVYPGSLLDTFKVYQPHPKYQMAVGTGTATGQHVQDSPLIITSSLGADATKWHLFYYQIFGEPAHNIRMEIRYKCRVKVMGMQNASLPYTLLSMGGYNTDQTRNSIQCPPHVDSLQSNREDEIPTTGVSKRCGTINRKDTLPLSIGDKKQDKQGNIWQLLSEKPLCKKDRATPPKPNYADGKESLDQIHNEQGETTDQHKTLSRKHGTREEEEHDSEDNGGYQRRRKIRRLDSIVSQYDSYDQEEHVHGTSEGGENICNVDMGTESLGKEHIT